MLANIIFGFVVILCEKSCIELEFELKLELHIIDVVKHIIVLVGETLELERTI